MEISELDPLAGQSVDIGGGRAGASNAKVPIARVILQNQDDVGALIGFLLPATGSQQEQ